MILAPVSPRVKIENGSMMSLRYSPKLQRLVKVAFDYAVVIPALISLAPMMLLIALLIKLESPGPVFHRRRVIGRRGREFNVYQFRTMYVNGDERLLRNRQQWVSILRRGRAAQDPRITRIGYFLRRSGLNHLPRLFNIIARHMSLVGPYIVTRKDAMRIDRQRIEAITSVLPGVTGLWQVNSTNSSTRERTSLELEYISNWSLRLDIQILFNTFLAVREELPS
jgi:lipopolysaccharide/colanic/teichoic acid biosynthesis glycosyltransferase